MLKGRMDGRERRKSYLLVLNLVQALLGVGGAAGPSHDALGDLVVARGFACDFGHCFSVLH